MTETPQPPQAALDAMTEAMDLVTAAEKEGVTVRLLGGMAVRVLCPDYPPRPSAGLQDIDLASVTPSRKALQNFLVAQGHQPDKNFNALYGHKQLYFISAVSGRPIDVLIDRLAMCHELEFRDRITRMPHTLDPLDVLLSKLQIVKLNEKDVRDIVYLLSGYPVRHGTETGTISLDLFRPIVGDDWGWWRTVTMNLAKIQEIVGERAAELVPDAAKYDPAAQAVSLIDAAEQAPKSRRWKMRARLGDRIRWYQEPEESTHH
ncbi:MAG: hypothetical protein ACLQFR_02040 [Streptosporangiaceae bacterium]